MWCGVYVQLLCAGYLGTSPSGCNGHHWDPHSRPFSQPEAAVCNTTKKQLAHPRPDRCATHHRPTSSSVRFQGGPPKRPTTHLRLGTSLHSRHPNPPTASADRDLPNWPPDWCLLNLALPRESQAAQTDSSLSPSSTTLSHPTTGTHTSIRDRSPRCCRRQQPGASPERQPPAAHPPSSPTQHPASPRRRRQQQHR